MVDQYSEMDKPKKVADRYLRQEVLGQGTYGVVFKATDTKVRVHILSVVLNLGSQETDLFTLAERTNCSDQEDKTW